DVASLRSPVAQLSGSLSWALWKLLPAPPEPAPHTLDPVPPRSVLLLPASTTAALAAPSLRATPPSVTDLRWALGNPEPLTFEPKPFQCLLRVPSEYYLPDISELSIDPVSIPVGFAQEASPAPRSGMLRPFYNAADFSLRPVWMADSFSRTDAAPRVCGLR